MTCGAVEGLTCSHFVKRGVHSLRWNLVNCNTQCGACNSRHNSLQEPYRRYMVKRYGHGVIDDLERSWSRTAPIKPHDLEDLVSALRMLYEKRDFLHIGWAHAFAPDWDSPLGIKPKETK